jgi:hypothetical protein
VSGFRKFDHVERLGHLETHGIEDGVVYVFAKLDGSNGSIWIDEAGDVQCGSRNRKLGDGSDNHGFRAWATGDSANAVSLRGALLPGLIFYGEWLVPHTVRNYVQEAWRRLWVFDVFDIAAGRYLAWDDYGPRLMSAGVDVLQPIAVMDKPTSAQLLDVLKADRTLLAPDAVGGEGIVCKRYDWQNRFGRQPWAKIVNGEVMGRSRATRIPNIGGADFETAIAAKFVTPEMVNKTRAKAVAEIANKTGIDLMHEGSTQLIESQYRCRVIPALLGMVYADLVREEMWAIVKEAKDPRIDFGSLRRACQNRTKELAVDLFGGAPVLAETGGVA